MTTIGQIHAILERASLGRTAQTPRGPVFLAPNVMIMEGAQGWTLAAAHTDNVAALTRITRALQDLFRDVADVEIGRPVGIVRALSA